MTYYSKGNSNNNNNSSNAANTGMFLKEKVELFLSLKDLVGKDRNSKSDPFIVVSLKQNGKSFVEIGRTEVIQDNHFPSFAKQFKLGYYFEEEQILRFDVYDEDVRNSHKLKDHDFIGSCSMELGQIVHESGQILAKKLLNKGQNVRNKKTGNFSHLICTLEKIISSGNELCKFQFSCQNLPKMDGFFGKSDPYFIVNRIREDGKSVNVYQSEIIKSNLNPIWKTFTIDSQKLCNNDKYRPIHILVYDWDRNGDHDFIGKCETNLNELKSKPQKMDLVRTSKKKYIGKVFGTLRVIRAESEIKASFLDYIQGGNSELSLMVAIDFTGSNGHPKDQQSLHFIYDKNHKPSPYQIAIRQICNIVSVYDADQHFPVFGFGAFFENCGVVHDFNLNFDQNNAEVSGVFGIEEAYLNSILSNRFQLSGPTLFQPILKKARNIVSNADQSNMSGGKLQYYILLIITDGIINDMKQTKDEIVGISNDNLPLSIIIVGVGSADFSKMDELDGDEEGLMNSRGQYAKRDVVQFVSLNKFKGRMNDLNRETLNEIPQQFLSYAQAKKIKPGIGQKKGVYSANKFQMNSSEANAVVNNNQVIIGNKPKLNVNFGGDVYENAPLPSGWEKAYDENGTVYYVNHMNKITQWNHPMQGNQ